MCDQQAANGPCAIHVLCIGWPHMCWSYLPRSIFLTQQLEKHADFKYYLLIAGL